MKTFALIGLVAFALFIGVSLALRPSEPTYVDLQRQQMAVEQAQTLAPIWTIAQALLILGIPVLLLGALGVALLKFFRRPELVRPDNAGRLPAMLADGTAYQATAMAALADYHATQRTAAAISPVPTSYAPHYSTSYAPHTASTIADGPASIPAQFAPASLEAPSYVLPDSALLSAFLPQIKAHCIAFGIDTSGRLLQAPLSQSYHLLSSGRTRSGKSNSLNLVLAQLHYQQRAFGLKTSISVLDYKEELSSIWRRSPLVGLSTFDPAEMVELLKDLVHGSDGLLARQRLFATEGERRHLIFGNLLDYEKGTGETLPRHYVCIDELNAVLIAADNKALGDELSKLLYLGAGAGIFIIGGAHSLDASTFRRAAKEQFSTRLQFGSFDQSAVNLMYGSIKVEDADVQLLDGRSGRGLVQLVSQSKPTPFQALQVEGDDILQYIDQPVAPAQIAAEQRLIAETTEVLEAIEQPDAPISDAVRRAVWRKKKAKINKAETIWQLWSVRKGGGESYQQASALYDRVLADGEPAGV